MAGFFDDLGDTFNDALKGAAVGELKDRYGDKATAPPVVQPYPGTAGVPATTTAKSAGPGVSVPMWAVLSVFGVIGVGGLAVALSK